MKVIFLDFDGVLNSEEFDRASSKGDRGPMNSMQAGIQKIDPEAVDRLNRLVKATGASIVISSSWRHIWEVSDICIMLADAGFRYVDSIIDRTPAGDGNRGQEIQEWLELDPEREVVNPDHEPVESYVILDDTDDMLPDQRENFVQTDPSTGLTDDDIDRAMYILGASA